MHAEDLRKKYDKMLILLNLVDESMSVKEKTFNDVLKMVRQTLISTVLIGTGIAEVGF